VEVATVIGVLKKLFQIPI